jgi:hypothetical protein
MPGMGHFPVIEDYATFQPYFHEALGHVASSQREEAHP